ncbi:MAG: hypothetical protein GX457_15735 [Thermotogaceae bacterium]|nr:hypothetical protein [Thermotogaceae bacterium]
MISRTSIGILLLLVVCGIGNSQIVEIPYKNWPYYSCLNSHNPEKFIINSKEGLDKIGHCNLTSFDIDKHTIIGIYGFSMGDRKPIVSYRIIKNTELKLYNIDASVYCGHFTYLRINHTYYRKVVFTDKLDPEYETDFNVQVIYDK